MPYASLTNTVEQQDQPASTKPLRILHVVGGMDRGGTETWLMHVLRHIDRDCLRQARGQRFQMDFLVYSDQHYAYTDEIQALGCQILSCPTPSKPWLFAANFKRVLQGNAPYDIIHVQVHLFSGYVLHLARQAGIKVRIVHSHIDTSSIESTANWRRKLYSVLMKWSIDKNSTAGLAASQIAAVDLFGSAWEDDSRWRTLYCGVDLAPFYAPSETTDIRAQLGIPADTFVIGHVGRFESQKNHQFVIEIAAELAKLEPNMRLVLIGVGSLRSEIEAKVIQMGLSEQVIFLGTRPDVPQLMRGLMDVFLFPSRYEGLGLVLVEAQAAGLPCIFSDVVPLEADLVKPLLQRLSLTQSASDWAKVVLATRSKQCAISQSNALDLVSQTAFNIKVSVQELTAFYNKSCRIN
jgi:glycosyltransferase involved in cell wall biosynthesis